MPNMQKQMEAEELKTCAIVRKSQNQEDEVYDLWHNLESFMSSFLCLSAAAKCKYASLCKRLIIVGLYQTNKLWLLK